MKVLITGGAGFIGSNLVRYINRVRPEIDINVIDDLSTGRRSNLDNLSCTLFENSILDIEALRESASGASAIVHLGAIPSVPRSVANPYPTHHANVTGTMNVLEVAREMGNLQVIAASSSSVYGSNKSLPKTETDWTRPMSPYGVSKLATEAYTIAYNHSYGLPTLAFRFFNVYGPGQSADHDYAAVIPKFLDAALQGNPLPVNGDGLQSRDFTFVETVCSVIAESLFSEKSSLAPVNLAFGTNTTLIELIKVLENKLGKPLEIHFQAERVGDIRASQADGIQVKKEFPLIEPVSLETGIEQTIAWFRSLPKYSNV